MDDDFDDDDDGGGVCVDVFMCTCVHVVFDMM